MIMSVADLRKYINTDEDDSTLSLKLKAVEKLIRNYTHNNFHLESIRSDSEILNNGILNPPEHLSVGETVEITNSLYNNGLYTITALSDGKAFVSAPLIDCKENRITKVFYPDDIIDGVINLIKWELDNRDKTGIQSEKISRYSVTYFNADNENSAVGFPKLLLGFLKPYRKARF